MPGRGHTRPNTSLVQVTRDPLDTWKTTLDVIDRAKKLGMETVVAVDARSSPGSIGMVKAVADRVFAFDSEDCWPEAQLNRVLDEATRDWAFLVSDDEMPSEELWRFACRVPEVTDQRGLPYLWRCRMLAPLPDWSALYRPLDTYQPRYFPREGIRWPGGFDEMPVSNLQEIDFDLVLWHYTLWSPREYRERKVAGHEAAWNEHWIKHPWPFPGRKSYLWEDHPEEHTPFGDFAGHRP